MSLAGGARLGPYEVQSPLGVGGMGEVYRARNTRLFYLAADQKIPTLQAGTPKPLLEAPALTGSMNYAVTRDGRRFLVPTAVPDLVPAPLIVILNWPAGLKR